MWATRKWILHGDTAEEAASRTLQRLHDQSDDTYVLPRHHHLFTSRTLPQCLKMPYDNAQSWLWSITEAREVLILHDCLLTHQSRCVLNSDQSSASSSSCLPSDTSTFSSYTSLTCSSHSPMSHQSWSTASSTCSSGSNPSISDTSISSPPTGISWSISTTFPLRVHCSFSVK